MNKNSTRLIVLAVVGLVATWILFPKTEDRLEITQVVKKKKFSRDIKNAFTRERFRYEYDMLKDPGTGRIPVTARQEEWALARTLPNRHDRIGSGTQGTDNLNNYIAAGPDSIGGRTRAVVYDKRYNNTTNRVIISGSVSGGIFRSSDGGANWTRVSPENDIHNLSTLAQDPRAGFENNWYAGGGEPVGNSTNEDGAPYLSYGVWKSTDNGVSWTKLPFGVRDIGGANLPAPGTLEGFDHPFDFVHKIVVNPTNGHVYVAGHRRLIRSTDGGSTWNVVFTGTRPAGSATGQMDIEVSPTGRLFLAVNGGLPDHGARGVWTSSSGNANSWTRLAGGNRLGIDSVKDWRGNSYKVDAIDDRPFPPDTTFFSKRIVIALAPSSEKILYVCYENGESQDGANPQPEADLFKLDMTSGANVWSNYSANMPDFPGELSGVDPLELQEGYNLTLAVKPDNPNVVFIGGTNLFRSTNGFSTKTATAWIAGYGQDFASGLRIYPSSHPDIHALAFMPNNNGINPGFQKAICANDGGIQFTENIMATGTIDPVAWNMIQNYQTLQYFHVAIDQKSNQNNFIGGAQDNGTQIRLNEDNFHQRIISGDGGAAAIGAITEQPSFTYTIYGSSQLGNIYRLKSGQSNATNLMPNGLTPFPGIDGFGDFVTYFKIDSDNPEDIYYANFNRLFRTKEASTMVKADWLELTGVRSKVNPGNPGSGTNISIRALELSRGPYLASHVLYIGTSNGKVFRLNDPRNAPANTSPVDITPPELEDLRAGGAPVNVADIAVNPNNDEEIMVVVSNYSATTNSGTINDFNIWWTNNAKSATPVWRKAEGNLTLPSIRSCMIVTRKDGNTPVTEYYVGTSVGLYSAVNIGATLQAGNEVNWVREGGNVLNFAVITSLDYRPVDNVLLVGTHGNGLYYAEIGNADFRPNQNTGINDPVRNDPKFIIQAFPSVTKQRIDYRIGNMFTIKKLIVRVENLAGQTMIRKEVLYTNGHLDVQALSKGMYILTITSADYKQQYVRKFFKE